MHFTWTLGGEIFFHAKSDSRGNLRYLAQKIKGAFPKGCIMGYEDIYGFVFRESRDLSGFIDGTENPTGRENRLQISVNPLTGGSFCVSKLLMYFMPSVTRWSSGIRRTLACLLLLDS